jgi:CRP-like cAMP-binding protein
VRKVLYVLGQLDDLDAEWLARAGIRRRLADQEAVILQGQPSPSLFIVLAGELAVDVAGVGRVARLAAGEVVGEMSFVDSAPPSATVLAAGDAFVLEVAKTALEAKIAADPGFGLRFYRAIALFLADRLRTTQQRKAAGGKVRLDTAEVLEDELDEKVLDALSLGGDRFDRMLRRLAGG